MLSASRRQASLFYAAFAREAALIKDDLLEPIDALLDDPSLVDLVRELRGSLVYRHFTRFDEAPIPDFSTFSRSFAFVGPAVTEQIHAHVVAIARQQRVASGHKLRTDTTVVESNVHYPTDSTLLQDGVRVLTRSLKRIAQECSVGAVSITDHARSAQRRVLEIHRAAKSFTEAARGRMQESYGRLMGLARRVVRTAEKVTDQLQSGTLPVPGNLTRVLLNDIQLRHFVPLVK